MTKYFKLNLLAATVTGLFLILFSFQVSANDEGESDSTAVEDSASMAVEVETSDATVYREVASDEETTDDDDSGSDDSDDSE